MREGAHRCGRAGGGYRAKAKIATITVSCCTLLLAALVLLPGVATQAFAGGGNGGGSSAGCGSNTVFYTYKASNFSGPGVPANFGPDFKVANVGEALTRFNQKKCEDPLWLAAVEQFFADGEAMSQTKAQDRAALFVKDHAAWQQAADDVTKQIADAVLTTSDQRYDSLGMIPGAKPTDMPQLTKFAEQPVLNTALDITLPNKEHRLLRIDCDEQPSVVKFTNVAAPQPKKEEAPQPPQVQQHTPQPPCTTCTCAGNCTTQCTSCECTSSCVQHCTSCECAGNCVQCTTCTCQGNCPQPCVTTCAKNWSLSVTTPQGVVPQPNDAYQARPAAPANPAPVQPANQAPTSGSQAPGATTPDPTRTQPAAGTGTTSSGGTGSVNPGGGTGTNTTDPTNPFG